MKRMTRNERFWVRISEVQKRGLEKAALKRDSTASELVRQAIRQVLADNKGAAKR